MMDGSTGHSSHGEFDLRAHVRSVCDASSAADPHSLAEQVLRQLPEGSTHTALKQAIFAYVRSFIVSSRYSAEAAEVKASDPPKPSPKVAAIRDHWQRLLRARISVGDSEWKFLGDCTAADLEYAAILREEQSRCILARAEQYRELIRLMAEHGAETVSELPENARLETLEPVG